MPTPRQQFVDITGGMVGHTMPIATIRDSGLHSALDFTSPAQFEKWRSIDQSRSTNTTVNIVSLRHALQVLWSGWQVTATTTMTTGTAVYLYDVDYSSLIDVTQGEG